MKKLYRKGTVHPSPPIISDHLSFLPATILTLAAALSPEDREVLAYLISCSNNNISDHRCTITQKANLYPKSTPNDHPPSFNCGCFSCYMSYWVRWDSSPNRQLIHEIIDAYEDGLLPQRKAHNKNKNKKDRKRKGNTNGFAELKRSESSSIDELAESHDSHRESSSRGSADGGIDGDEVEAQSSEKGSVRRFMSFIGERIWGVIG